MEKRYRLKDSELQDSLDKLTGYSEFTDKLQKHKELARTADGFIKIEFGNYESPILKSREGLTFSVWLHEDDIEEVQYNPKAWNKFPHVLPPLRTPMRVIHPSGHYGCAMYVHSTVGSCDYFYWDEVIYGCPTDDGIEDDYGLLFRPWEDDEEKDE